MASSKQEVRVEVTEAWLAPALSDAKRRRILEHVEGLASTRVPVALPITIGMMAALALAIGLTLASL